MSRPRFSVISVDYEKSVPREEASAGIQSLVDQTYQNFETIIVHDGDASDDWWDWASDLPPGPKQLSVYATGRWHGSYGHWSRDLGMRVARGAWFIQHNIANTFEPWAFQRISDAIDVAPAGTGAVVFPIYHKKLGRILTGNPAALCHIDAMQMVASYETWRDIGFWCDHTDNSDGILYEFIASRTNVLYLDGEPFGVND